MHRIAPIALASTFALAVEQQGLASVTLYDQYAAWSEAAGQFTTVTFDEVPHPTNLTGQYAHLGIQFVSADPDIAGFFANASDQAAVNGLSIIEIAFAAPINAFATLHPGTVRFRLFSGDAMVFQSPYMGGGGWGWLSGVVSSIAFDRIQLSDFDEQVFVDNIYFSTIPGPGGLAVLGLAVLLRGCRRRPME